MEFLLGQSSFLLFEQSVLDHFNMSRQIDKCAAEAGGQLFAKFEGSKTIIKIATGPRPLDKRGRFFYLPSRFLERQEIRKMYKVGFHYVGDWHTHPEDVPTPSAKDVATITDCFSKSNHDLTGFLLVIVGTSSFPSGLSVTYHNESACEKLMPKNGM